MPDSIFSIKEEVKKLPVKPGVYIMYDIDDVIIYVGKAKSLKNRVSQYFRKSHDEGVKKNRMVTNIVRFDYIITDTEMEALVLENNLIKEHSPKYNTLLRDDKTYPYIKVTIQERYPRIYLTRKQGKDRAKYFGPFTSAGAVKDTIELIQKTCRLRTCNHKLPDKKVKLCLNYHIHQCSGACQELVSEAEYRDSVNTAIKFLEGDYKGLEDMLKAKMEAASRTLDFEKAAEYRDLINSLHFCIQRQKITGADNDDRDIIGIAVEQNEAAVSVFFVRNGKIIGREKLFLTMGEDESKKDLYRIFIQRFYSGTPYIPHEIYIEESIDDLDLTEKWLSSKRGKRVYIKYPQRGEKEKLINLAVENAQIALKNNIGMEERYRERGKAALKEICSLLNVDTINRIEAYDISNISGFAQVGSMVVFEDGIPLKHDYRKFKIKSVNGANDYASMKEMLIRRFKRGIDGGENSSFNKLPDLILMDGGAGQVNIALQVLKELELDINVCGMVKDDRHNTRALWYNGSELPIDKKGEGFKLITRVQDEAHRFAITYHKLIRGKTAIKSFLDDIPGIGPKRRRELMKRFSGREELFGAKLEDILEVASMDIQSAKAVYNFLHNEEGKG